MEQQDADKKMIAEVQQILSTMDLQGQLKRQSARSGSKVSKKETRAIIIFLILIAAAVGILLWSYKPASVALPQPIPAGQQVRT
jgi:hypothetical protein